MRAIGEERLKRRLASAYPDAKTGRSRPGPAFFCASPSDPSTGPLGHPERATSSVSVGRIAGEYYFAEPGLHCRTVSWLAATCLPRCELSDVARRELSARVAFFAVRESASKVELHAG